MSARKSNFLLEFTSEKKLKEIRNLKKCARDKLLILGEHVTSSPSF